LSSGAAEAAAAVSKEERTTTRKVTRMRFSDQAGKAGLNAPADDPAQFPLE
jgi:hypothetical protein